jgi:amino acid transporter, AAT family
MARRSAAAARLHRLERGQWGDSMTIVEDGIIDNPTQPALEQQRVPAFGRFTPVITTLALFVLGVVSWWLIGDPEWSVFGAKADGPADEATKLAIVSCLLFWTILGHIFTGFTFGNWPFNKLSQPMSGIAQVLVDLVIGILGTLLFTRGVGAWDPTFSANAAGGLGYTAAAFIVLIGFYAYAMPVASLGGYPFESVPPPTSGVANWLLGAFLTVVGVVALVYPNFNSQLSANAPVSLPTVTGWIYSSIVIVIVGAMQWGNWPWAGIADRHLRAVTALVVSLGGGYLLMLIFEAVLRAILPEYVVDTKGFPIALETAQLGVFFSLCSLIAGLIFGPTKLTSVLASRVVRTVLVTIAAILSYVVFTRLFATTVLHFPAVKGNYGGNPLLWADWMILLVLWHAVAFGGYLSTRRAPSRRKA